MAFSALAEVGRVDVIDPRLPAPLVTSYRKVASAVPAAPASGQRFNPRPQVSEALEIGSTWRQVRVVGNPLVAYVRDGQIYQLNLRRGASNAETRISNLTNACEVGGKVPLDATGTDVWWLVTIPGSDGLCSSVGTNTRYAFVRSGSSATTPPARLSQQSLFDSAVAALSDGSRRALWIALYTGTDGGIELLRPDTLAAGPAVVGAGRSGSRSLVGDFVTSDPTTPSAEYARLGNDLRRLSWDASGATLGPVLHTFTGADPGYAVAAADANFAWIADGARILRLSGTNAAVVHATLAAPAAVATELLVTQDHVLVWSQPASAPAGSRPALSSVRKAGGAEVSLGALTGTGGAIVYAIRGNRIAVGRFTSASGTADWIWANADGTDPRTVARGATIAANVRPLLPDGQAGDTDHLILYQEPAVATTPGNRNGGDLLSLDMATGAVTTIGRVDLPGRTLVAGIFGSDTATLPLVIHVNSRVALTNGTDVLLSRDLAPGSLQLVTDVFR